MSPFDNLNAMLTLTLKNRSNEAHLEGAGPVIRALQEACPAEVRDEFLWLLAHFGDGSCSFRIQHTENDFTIIMEYKR